jgi:tRNA modification GTPase
VRLSGKKAVSIADKIFVSKQKLKPFQFKSHTLNYGHIISDNKKEIIDEVLLSVMRSPKTYTKEDIVEINCHGGIVPLKKILELVLKNGARLALPGEFTKRAFLNGRLDLAQAEAVLDIIQSKTESSLKVALNQLEGHLSKEVRQIKDEILDIYAQIEASIDFPDEDIEIFSEANILSQLKKVEKKIDALLNTAGAGLVFRQGILTVICGKPNVGKSSLLNALLRQERAIVTPIPGTTRDTIEEIVNIKGVPLRMVDTAGIAPANNLVEEEGINRSQRCLKQADLTLLVLDGSQTISKEDKKLLEQVEKKKTVVVINKIDLPLKLKLNGYKKYLKNKKIVRISATQKKNLSSLEKAISDLVWQGKISSSDEILLSNVRHGQALREALEAIRRAEKTIKEKMSLEFVAVDIKESLDNLGLIVGETATEDLLDKIFEKFCIGK